MDFEAGKVVSFQNILLLQVCRCARPRYTEQFAKFAMNF